MILKFDQDANKGASSKKLHNLIITKLPHSANETK